MDRPRVYNTGLDKDADNAQIGTRVLCYYGYTTIEASTLPSSMETYPHVPAQFSDQRRQPNPSNTAVWPENQGKVRRPLRRRKHAHAEVAADLQLPLVSASKEDRSETAGADAAVANV